MVVSLLSELLEYLLILLLLELNYRLPFGMIFFIVVVYFLRSRISSRINLNLGINRQGIELLVRHLQDHHSTSLSFIILTFEVKMIIIIPTSQLVGSAERRSVKDFDEIDLLLICSCCI